MSFIRCHAHVNFLSPVDASSDGLHISLALVSAALTGVGRRGGFYSHMFTLALWRGCHLTTWVCLFLQGVF